MKIGLIGDFEGKMDEGFKLICNNTYLVLKKNKGNELIDIINTRQLLSRLLTKKLDKDFDILHFFTGPSFISILIILILNMIFPKSKIVVTALHPTLSNYALLMLTRIDALIVQSDKNKNIFKKYVKNVINIYPGVDIEKFKPVDLSKKILLRNKYNLSQDKPILLHVGHLKKERNLSALEYINTDDFQVVLVGSSSTNSDEALCSVLRNKGFKLMNDYYPNIEEIYSLSDIYIFPVVNQHACIETPLSILEAMSCNLPIITTDYGGISDILSKDVRLYILNSSKELISQDLEKYIKLCLSDTSQFDNRKFVSRYSWDLYLKKLFSVYRQLVGNFKI